MLQSSWAYVRGAGCSSRWHPRLGPRLERTQALCGPCVSRRGISPAVCGRRTRAELHIQDIGPRMLPSSAALRRGASCRHPCCSFPCSALCAHGTLHSPVRGKHLRVLCATNPEVRRFLRKKGPTGRMGTTAALRNVPEQTSWKAEASADYRSLILKTCNGGPALSLGSGVGL